MQYKIQISFLYFDPFYDQFVLIFYLQKGVKIQKSNTKSNPDTKSPEQNHDNEKILMG